MSFPQHQGVNIITIKHLNQYNLKKNFRIILARVWPDLARFWHRLDSRAILLIFGIFSSLRSFLPIVDHFYQFTIWAMSKFELCPTFCFFTSYSIYSEYSVLPNIRPNIRFHRIFGKKNLAPLRLRLVGGPGFHFSPPLVNQ
jgi:hypothetical protein